MVETITKAVIAGALLAGLGFLTNIFVVNTTWFQGAYDVVFPAHFALSALPIADTLIAILTWVVVFEMVFFAFRTLLNIIKWVGIGNGNFLTD